MQQKKPTSLRDRIRQHVILPLCSPRFGHVVPPQSYNNLKNQFPNLGALNNYKENVQHSIMSVRNVETLTFLAEEGSHPSYERNEDDAFVSSTLHATCMDKGEKERTSKD